MSAAHAPLLLFPIANKDQEHAFQLKYHAAAVLLDPLLSFLGLISHVAKQALIGPGPAATPDGPFITTAFWFRTAILAVQLLAVVLLSKPRYISLRGPLTTWHKVVFVAGSGFGFKHCSCSMCPMLWRHRCLLIHATSAVARVPAGWYWQGASACWMLATLIDATSPAGEAGGSARQALTRVLALFLNGPSEVLRKLTNGSTVHSAVINAAGLALPGLLLTYMEASARRAWQQQQQQPAEGEEAAAATEQQPAVQPAETAAAVAATERMDRSSTVSSQQQVCVGGMCGTPTPLTEACALAAAAAAAAAPQTCLAAAAAAAARLTRSTETLAMPSKESASSASSDGASSDSSSSDSASTWSQESHTAGTCTPATTAAAAAAGGGYEGAADVAAEAATVAAAAGSGEEAAVVTRTAVAPSLSAAAAAAHALAPAGAGAGGAAQLPFAPYHSTLARSYVHIKLQGPQDTGVENLERTRTRLTAALPDALTAVLNPAEHVTPAAAAVRTFAPQSHTTPGQTAAAAAASSSIACTWPAVTQALAFHGCYQFVFELVQPAAAAAAQGTTAAASGSDTMTQLQQAVADQLLPDWTVLAVQLDQPTTDELQQQQRRLLLPAPGFLAAAAAADMHLALRPAATTPPTVADAAGELTAAVSAGAHQRRHPTSTSEVSDAASSSSSSSSSDSSSTAVAADLLVPHQRVLQLHQDGHQQVRVVLLSHPPGQPLGAVLLDNTVELQVPSSDCGSDLLAPLQLKVDLQQWQAVHNSGRAAQSASAVATSDPPTSDDTSCQALSVIATLAAAAAATGTTPAADHILAHLPLLLLPAKAADELQLLLTSAVTAGVRYCTAYHLLLPLLQDWALVILLGRNGNAAAAAAAAAASVAAHAGLRVQMDLAVDALAGYFTKHQMPECLRALQAAARGG